jgi:hypothetical protein
MPTEFSTNIHQWINEGKEEKTRETPSHMQLLDEAWEDLSRAHEAGDIEEFSRIQEKHAGRILGFWQGRLRQYFVALKEQQDTSEVKYGNLFSGIKLKLSPSETLTVAVKDDIDARINKEMQVERWAPLVVSDDIDKKRYESTKVILNGMYRSDDVLPSIRMTSHETDIVGWPAPSGYELKITNGNIESFKRVRVIEDNSATDSVQVTKTESIKVAKWNRDL